MYSDKIEKNRVWLWRALALAALVALIWCFIRLGCGKESRENGGHKNGQRDKMAVF